MYHIHTYVPGTSEPFVANCGVGPSTRGQGDSASLVKPTQDQQAVVSRGERESLYTPQLDRKRDAARQRAAATRRRETNEARATHTHSNVLVTTKALACNCWGTDSDTSTPCVDESRRCRVYCCTAVTAVVSS